MQLMPEDREAISGRLVIASVSGGKDSSALSLWLTEQGIEHERVFADTGWEADATYEYLRGPLTDALGPIVEVSSGHTFESLAIDKGMFPRGNAKWCTDALKMEPLIAYMSERASTVGPVISANGVRAGESVKRSQLTEWDGFARPGIEIPIWRPLLRWSEDDVIAIHRRHGLAPNPLYLAGANRVGCWPCINSRKSEWRLIADTDPNRIRRVAELERRVGEVAEARADESGEPLRIAPSFFVSSIKGEPRNLPVDRVVAWSRTSRGGRQFDLLGPDPNEGCVRWGMCEHPTDAAAE